MAPWLRRVGVLGAAICALPPACSVSGVKLLTAQPRLARAVRSNAQLFKLYLAACWWPYCFYRRLWLSSQIRRTQREALYVRAADGEAAERVAAADLPSCADSSARLVFISDTHRCERWLSPPHGDVLIHCGDALLEDRDSGRRSEAAAQSFARWLRAQPHRYKLLLGGNHDAVLERLGPAAVQRLLQGGDEEQGQVLYLHNEILRLRLGCGRVLSVGGTPHSDKNSAASTNSAFQTMDGSDATSWLEHGSDSRLDVLLSHGPGLAAGLGKGAAGAAALSEWVSQHRPRLHAFGHVHAGYGVAWQQHDTGGGGGEPGATLCINAAMADAAYAPLHPPVVVDLPLQAS